MLGHGARDRQKRLILEVVSAQVQIANDLNGVLELMHFNELKDCVVFVLIADCH